MTMISKIADRHLTRQACIYIRQSTPAQVRLNQESTERQYNLLNKARSLGWKAEQIRVLDRDLGQSGAAATKRADFKVLVGDVAMGQIGAIFAWKSRLARSGKLAPPARTMRHHWHARDREDAVTIPPSSATASCSA
jgi:DNA invertase Pin-like site-specific DNA recombinase